MTLPSDKELIKKSWKFEKQSLALVEPSNWLSNTKWSALKSYTRSQQLYVYIYINIAIWRQEERPGIWGGVGYQGQENIGRIGEKKKNEGKISIN